MAWCSGEGSLFQKECGVAVVEEAKQGGEGGLGFDGDAAGAEPQEDVRSVSDMGADVKYERPVVDELTVELPVPAGAAGFA